MDIISFDPNLSLDQKYFFNNKFFSAQIIWTNIFSRFLEPKLFLTQIIKILRGFDTIETNLVFNQN